jgi:alkylhydroperoxidase family enzyme
VDPVIADYRSAPLEAPVIALLDWCVRLTRQPASCTEADVQALRTSGWSDEEISAAGFVCSYFNFINRVADGLGVDLEAWMKDRPALGPCPW